jgi:hypothetical protein
MKLGRIFAVGEKTRWAGGRIRGHGEILHRELSLAQVSKSARASMRSIVRLKTAGSSG